MTGKARERIGRVERSGDVGDAGRRKRQGVAAPSRRNRDEREGERLPLPGSEVCRCVGRRREPDCGDDLTSLERDERAVGICRTAVEVEERNLPLSAESLDHDRRVAYGECRSEVGGMRRDTVARLEVVLSVVADLGITRVPATEPACPLLAAVVPAASVLAEVAADGALVAQERRGCKAGGRRDDCVRLHPVVGCEIRKRRRRSDAKTFAVGRDAAEPRALEVDEQRGRADPPVDLPGEIGAACEHGGTVLEEQLERLCDRRRPYVEGHESTSSTRSRVSGRAAARRPVACANAFAIAAAVGMMGGSPRPLLPVVGRFASGTWG